MAGSLYIDGIPHECMRLDGLLEWGAMPVPAPTRTGAAMDHALARMQAAGAEEGRRLARSSADRFHRNPALLAGLTDPIQPGRADLLAPVRLANAAGAALYAAEVEAGSASPLRNPDQGEAA